ncbi:hypothetical protein KKI95_18645 [Xenorhabdus bovienii]|nr:hypothetical protein [Xenorhabdus bovienii]MDE1497081.1 hypothetical protein [Xenorhabdus bovienii]MDE9437887.1 hypothetical protein [Xenorhabdus bovienii]MDE9447480.1 hypothetical protein [Xenorhabdus bovienii]MDE9475024.1 hypothetical protein [Xenorhabdus bovienii]MDE9483904.1 hypothetical protein [Xenorhabdus bovienii]
MAGKIKLPHTCPKCKKAKAETEEELKRIFGYRLKDSGVTNQSYCKDCR